MVVAPGDMAQLSCQGWDGQSGAFPPPMEMGPVLNTNPPDPALGSSLTTGRKNQPQTGLCDAGAAPAAAGPHLTQVTRSEPAAGSQT